MSEFHNRLSLWYKENRRPLPWRASRNPYFIWISEVILQQTRVAQGTGYYHRFILRFPDIESLAMADEAEVLKLWQGLGYYSRARNLHAAAKQIVEQYQAVFPSDYVQIRSLRGVGDYTAAAIASIAFQLPYAAIDGNVLRVLARIFGLKESVDSPSGRKLVAQTAQKLLDRQNPGEFNQALMEFGATVCTPRNPGCQSCIFQQECFAYRNDEVVLLPVRTKDVKVRDRYFYFMVIGNDTHYWLEQRQTDDIWAGLYQFPLIESSQAIDTETLCAMPEFSDLTGNLSFRLAEVSAETTHLLTHQRLHIRFVVLQSSSELKRKHCIRVKTRELKNYPVPKPIERFLVRLYK